MEADDGVAELPAEELEARLADVRKRAFRRAKRRRGGDEAEDIAQEIAESVRKRLGVQPHFLSDPEQRQAYVTTAVKNKCIDRRKAEKAAKNREIPMNDHLYSKRSSVYRPDNFLDKHEDSGLEWDLEMLPQQMADIIVRLYFLDQPASHVARELGITPQTVHTQKKRGLAKLRKMKLQREMGPPAQWERLHREPKHTLTPEMREMILEVRRQFKKKGLPWDL